MRPSRADNKLFRLLLVLAFVAISIAPGPVRAEAQATPQAMEADFQEGLRALSAGNATKAIRLFRAILASEPNLPRVRLELARAYYLAREWERSRQEFFAVLSSGVPASVKANILRFLQAIDARRGFDWDLSVAFAASPDTGRTYDTDTLMVDVFGIPLPFIVEREEDGAYGLRARGDAEYRLDVPGVAGDGLRLTVFGKAGFDVFESVGTRADDRLVSGHIGLRGAWPQTTVLGAPFVSTRHFGGEHLEDRVGLESSVEWRSASGLSVFGSGSAGLVDDHVSEARDGQFGRLRSGLAQSIGGRAAAGFALGFERLEADDQFESYTTLGGEIFGRADVSYGVDVNARSYLLRQEYDERIPFLFEARDEWEYGLDVELVKSDFFLLGQFNPFVKGGYSRRNSSVDAFSYREGRFEIGLQKAF